MFFVEGNIKAPYYKVEHWAGYFEGVFCMGRQRSANNGLELTG